MPTPPLSRSPGRGIPIRLSQTVEERDLYGTKAVVVSEPIGVGITVEDDTTSYARVTDVQFTGDVTVTEPAPGMVVVDINGSPSTPTSFSPTELIVLQAQISGANDDTQRNSTYRNLSEFTKGRYVIRQTNTGGGTYHAQWNDSGTWTDFLTPFTTTGNDTFLSMEYDIDPSVIAESLPEIRVLNDGTSSDTDTSYCALLLYGPSINGLKGDPGTDGIDGTNGTNGANGTNGTNGTNALPLFRTLRVAVPALTIGIASTITATWATAFADNNYEIAVSVISSAGFGATLTVEIVSQTASACIIRVTSPLSLSSGLGFISLIAVHN